MPFRILFICFILVAAKSSAQIVTKINWTEKTSQNPTDLIYYSSQKKLTWADFKGTPNQPEPIAAITFSGFGYKASMHSEDGKGVITVEVYCYFSKPTSWVRKNQNTPYNLTHEQHHFDATYIIAKAFIDSIKTANLTTENMNEKLAIIYKQSKAALLSLQNKYDSATKNGRLENEQMEWNNYFDKRLLLLIN